MLKPGESSVGVKAKKERLRNGLIERKRYLTELLAIYRETGNLPGAPYIPRATKLAIREWHIPERGIFKMAHGTLLQYPELVDDILKLIQALTKALQSTQNKAPKTRGSEINVLKSELGRAKRQIQALTDELIALRHEYNDALKLLDSNEQISRHRQHAIRRHRENYGLPRLVPKDDAE